MLCASAGGVDPRSDGGGDAPVDRGGSGHQRPPLEALPRADGACGGGEEGTAAIGARLGATPSCDDGDEHPTQGQTEGPYDTPGSPRRGNLVSGGVAGPASRSTGLVVDQRCRPVAGALLDFWQTDRAGRYDNAGYRLRGHQFTDPQGRFDPGMVIPGLYPSRTRHIHVKLQRPHGRILTTQPYFPGELRNADDPIFRRRAARGPAALWRRAHFSFVVR